MAIFYGDWGTVSTSGATISYRVYITAQISETPDAYTINISKAGFQMKSNKKSFLGSVDGPFTLYINGTQVGAYKFQHIYSLSVANDIKSMPFFEGSIQRTFSKTHSSFTATVMNKATDVMVGGGKYGGTLYNYNRNPQKTGTFTVPAKASYSVSYNANGGSGAPGGQTKWHNESLKLQTGVPSRSDHTFAGWATSSSGIVAYSAGGTLASGVNNAITLYARWNPKVYYNPNGGTGAPGTQTKPYNANLTLSGTKPTRVGYTFKNWNTAANGSGTTYNSSGTYSTNSPVTLYAQWTPISVTLTYNANGGSNAPASQTKVYDTPLKLQTGIPTRTGYTFKGWATTQARANAGTVDYSAGGTYSTNQTSNFTLWAAWTPNPYDVTYNANGGTGAPSAQIKYHNISLALRNEIPVRDRWLFRGWATSKANAETRKNSGVAEYLPGNTYTGNTPLTLWAIWHAVYTYTFTTKRVEAKKSTRVVTDGNWIMIELSISSPDVSGNKITSILFKDRDISKSATQSISWYVKEGSGGQQFNNPLVFPYIPKSNNIVLYGWYQRNDEEARLERHTFSIQVDDAIKNGEEKIIVLPPVYKIIDVKPPGDGIAFGKTATKVGMEIAMPVYIEGNPLFVTDIKPLEDKIAFGKAATNPGVEFAMPVSIENKPLTISNATINQINTTIDLKEADNGITAVKYYAHVYRDKNNKEQGRFGFGTLPDGRTRTEMYVRNYDTDGNMVGNKGFAINMDKSGNVTYSVTQPEQLRAALSLQEFIDLNTILRVGTASNLSMSNWTTVNCSGSITTSLANASSGYYISLSGRIAITNFSRTGANPGASCQLGVKPKHTFTQTIGFRAESPREYMFVTVDTNGLATFRTSETYTNAGGSTLTFIIPNWIVNFNN